MPNDRRIDSDHTGVTIGRPAAAAGAKLPDSSDPTDTADTADTADAPARNVRRVGAAVRTAAEAETAEPAGAAAGAVTAVSGRAAVRVVVVEGVVVITPTMAAAVRSRPGFDAG